MDRIARLARYVCARLADFEFEVLDQPFGLFRRWQFQLLGVEYSARPRVGREVYIKARGNLRLGCNCAIGSFSRFWNYQTITIGDDFLGAGGLVINTATHDLESLEGRGAPVRIGQRVWCGQNVIILAGVCIGDDVVIGAGSVVTGDLPSNCVAAGVPCRVLKQRP